jgi:CBS domain-containing protein
MRVHDLIASRQEVFSISPESTVLDAARYLRDHQIRAVGVQDQQGQLVGILSQSDISVKVAAENRCPAWVKVEEVMSSQLITVKPETSLEECLHTMEAHGIFHLLVVEDSGRFQGLVSAKDLLKLIALDSKERADMLASYISQPAI